MADNSDSGSDAILSFKVKTSGDKSHAITIAESATVMDLKAKLAAEDVENVSVERQRLIYSGRVMKNEDALSTYKIKNGNTIHMVKSAASNPAPQPSAASAPTPAAVPQNMAAGTEANNLLAGLTGARFAGHANLPNPSMFGADGGMGAPPNEDQMADMLSNPAVAATMAEALNNPNFIDIMIQNNPMLAQIPNAREMLQSPYFRNMMTNPDALRMAARMRRMMGGGGGGSAFPAPGATDTTPAGAPASDAAAGNNAAAGQAFNPFMMPGMFGGAPGGNPGMDMNALAGLFGVPPATGQTPVQNPTSPPAGGQTGTDSAQRGTTGSQPTSPPSNAAQANPFAALFGGMPGAQGAAAAGQNPFQIPGMPPISPEQMQQAMQMFGAGVEGGGFPGGFGGFGVPPAAAAPPDNRPPEERYAEQLRQLNDMGFFDFDRNVAALRRSGGSVQGAIEHLLGGS